MTTTPRRTDARINRERLITAAQEVFAEAGPEASLNEIARRAGVGPGTLYRNFPNREALLAAVLQERVERLCALAAGLLDGKSADEALETWLYAFVKHARLNRGMGSALLLQQESVLREGPPSDTEGAPAPTGVDCHRMIQEAAHALLTRAQQRGTARPDLSSDDLVALVIGIALSTVHHSAQQDEEQPRRLLELVLDAAHGRDRRA